MKSSPRCDQNYENLNSIKLYMGNILSLPYLTSFEMQGLSSHSEKDSKVDKWMLEAAVAWDLYESSCYSFVKQTHRPEESREHFYGFESLSCQMLNFLQIC